MSRPHLRRRRRELGPAPVEASADHSEAVATQATSTLTDDRAGDRAGDRADGGATPALAPEPAAKQPPSTPPASPTAVRRRFLDATPLLLVRSAHPRQTLTTAVLMTVAAALADRPTRDLGLVLVTVLVGQAMLGWHNDLVDRRRDAQHQRAGKPLSDARLDPGTAWFALACASLLVIPLSLSNGITAGVFYLASLGIGLVGNVVLRTGPLSWLPWALAFSLYPAFLTYGGWGNHDGGTAPEPAMTVLAALLGIGVHVLTALWGLVADHEDGWRYLPLRLGMRIGAARLLAFTSMYLALVVAAMIVTGTLVGLKA